MVLLNRFFTLFYLIEIVQTPDGLLQLSRIEAVRCLRMHCPPHNLPYIRVIVRRQRAVVCHHAFPLIAGAERIRPLAARQSMVRRHAQRKHIALGIVHHLACRGIVDYLGRHADGRAARVVAGEVRHLKAGGIVLAFAARPEADRFAKVPQYSRQRLAGKALLMRVQEYVVWCDIIRTRGGKRMSVINISISSK